MILPLDSSIESKCKYKSDTEAKESCKAIKLDDKDSKWAAVGLAFRTYFVLVCHSVDTSVLNIPVIVYYITQFVRK
jgi:hypothetical protein